MAVTHFKNLQLDKCYVNMYIHYIFEITYVNQSALNKVEMLKSFSVGNNNNWASLSNQLKI